MLRLEDKKRFLAALIISLLAFVTPNEVKAADVLKQLMQCYHQMPWFSWVEPYYFGEAIPAGSYYNKGDEVQYVILPATWTEKQRLVSGLYLFTSNEAFIYKFPAVLPEGKTYKMKLDFIGPKNEDRRVWIKYTASGHGHVPKLEFLNAHQADAQYMRLVGQPIESDLVDPREAFANETARFISAMHDTYIKQLTQAEASSVDRSHIATPYYFFRQLNLCDKVEHPMVKKAVRLEREKFLKRSMAARELTGQKRGLASVQKTHSDQNAKRSSKDHKSHGLTSKSK